MQTFAPKEDISFVHKELWKWNRSSAGSKVVGHSDDFILRGADKVKIEWGLLAIAHNIAKGTGRIRNQCHF